MVEVAVPSATIEVGDAVIVDVAGSGRSVTVTVAVFVIDTVFSVPVMVAVPAVRPAVSVAV
jgi:hypothetical protein